MTNFLDWLAQRRKAITALVTPGATLFIADVATGHLPTAGQWQAIGLLSLASAIGVHYVPNKVKR